MKAGAKVWIVHEDGGLRRCVVVASDIGDCTVLERHAEGKFVYPTARIHCRLIDALRALKAALNDQRNALARRISALQIEIEEELDA
jgi:mRNA-degrading endonuclease toxin of MazEF toxin-antitoxin module